jgi:hypothetical protein
VTNGTDLVQLSTPTPQPFIALGLNAAGLQAVLKVQGTTVTLVTGGSTEIFASFVYPAP